MAVYQDPVTKRSRYQAAVAGLKSDRSSFDAHWRELADFLMPRRTRFWAGDKNRGDKRNQNIINSTGRFAARTLASGLHAGLTSPARPWMKLTTPDQDLAKFGPVREWLHVVTQRMLTIFATSNLYNVLPMVYGDMGVFGSAGMSILDDSRDLFRCYSYPVGSYWLGQDARGLATTFMREYQLSVRAVVEQFGLQQNRRDIDWTRISSRVKALWDSSHYEAPVDVTWIVQPNEDADPTRLPAKYLPWSSCYFETGDQERGFLRESGFRKFPIMAPRWDITGEDTYGTDCPGMTALGDVKQLQIMERRGGQALAKMVDPPLVGPSALRTQKTSLLPGDITYLDAAQGSQGLKTIHDVTLRLDQLEAKIGAVEYRIKRAFYEDLFLMLATSDPSRGDQPITAREVDERHEEKLLALGPVLERTNDELLDPIVDRVFEMMATHGMLPPPPQDLEGVELKVEYVSILSQAQKLVGVVGQDRFLQTMGPLYHFYPELRSKVNIFQFANNYADMLGIDPRAIHSDEEAMAAVNAERQQAAQQAGVQQAALAAKAAKDASAAQISANPGDTALSRIINGVPGVAGAQ